MSWMLTVYPTPFPKCWLSNLRHVLNVGCLTYSMSWRFAVYKRYILVWLHVFILHFSTVRQPSITWLLWNSFLYSTCITYVIKLVCIIREHKKYWRRRAPVHRPFIIKQNKSNLLFKISLKFRPNCQELNL